MAPEEPEADGESADLPVRRATDGRYRRALWAVERAVLGKGSTAANVSTYEFDRDRVRDVLASVRVNGPLATFARKVSAAAAADVAQVETVRALLDAGQKNTARSFIVGMSQLPGGADMRRVGMGQVLHATGEFGEGWNHLREVDVMTLSRLVPVEAVTCALSDGGNEARMIAHQIGEHAMTECNAGTLAALAGRFLVTGDTDLAVALVEEAGRHDSAAIDDDVRAALQNLRRWTHPRPADQAPEGAIRVGVIDYYQPDLDLSSRNVGDYVQTLAMLGNITRFEGVRFSGPDGLGELASDVQQKIRPELRLEGPAADVHLVPISRDYSVGDAVPDNTWMVAFGWHMHSTYRLGFGLPYHPNLNPLFVSLHLNWTGVHSPEAIEYFREHGPIGCRDWTTVYLLLSVGVDAFFTGCLTTTVNASFPDLSDDELDDARVVGVIDLPESKLRKIKGKIEVITHADPEYRFADLVTGVRSAQEILGNYQRRYKRVVTSRLHSYLPATSLGIPTKFKPKTYSDIRFDGLLDMAPGEPAFEDMRAGIRDLIADAFSKVYAGASRAEVYAHWRAATAPLVEEARARFEAESACAGLTFDPSAAVAETKRSTFTYGPLDRVDAAGVTDVAMSTDENFKHLLPVTVQSMVTNASGPLRLWITARGLDEEYRSWFHRAFPDLPVTFLGFDHVEYGEVTRMIKHITVATMDRLLLPEVLPHVERLVYIDIDTVTTGDVCELAAIDLKGKPLAGRPGRQSALSVWRMAGNALTPDRAVDLRRTMARRHGFDFKHINCGVLVLDLAKMRADRFVERFVPLIGVYGLNDQDILNAYAGRDRRELEPRWNALPVIEDISEPGIVHYAGAGKPWSDEIVPFAHYWLDAAEQLRMRAGAPPA